MALTVLAGLAIAAYFAANAAMGLYYRGRATASPADYFVSGRRVSGSPGRRWSPPRSPPTRRWR